MIVSRSDRFAAEEFPNVVADGDVGVVALLAKRTFWEKATILHAEYHRAAGKTAPGPIFPALLRCGNAGPRTDPRQRHLRTWIFWPQVVRHKETFYPSAWARYDLAHPGTFRLVPPGARIAALERDYRKWP